ncbi:hypothetical protein [Methanorbis furvi]|uniref:Uncharacterized protein n=1 Tax=Methanorbis furvi TaxID=3028299 RepID=A0AAE4SA32_9EURY|nr:hypothetical protein [Methanocorpusculaceae archaeon Ag1]
MALLVKNLYCRACGSPLKAKEADLILFCPACRKTMEFLDSDVGEVVPHILAPKSENKDLVYLPFWRIDTDITVTRCDTVGGFLRITKKPMRGLCSFYVCAADLMPRRTAGWNLEFSRSMPKAEEIQDFRRVPHLPAVKNSKIAEKDAEFLFLKHEVDLSGTLQDIEYNFAVRGHELYYVPFIRRGDNLSPAV